MLQSQVVTPGQQQRVIDVDVGLAVTAAIQNNGLVKQVAINLRSRFQLIDKHSQSLTQKTIPLSKGLSPFVTLACIGSTCCSKVSDAVSAHCTSRATPNRRVAGFLIKNIRTQRTRDHSLRNSPPHKFSAIACICECPKVGCFNKEQAMKEFN